MMFHFWLLWTPNARQRLWLHCMWPVVALQIPDLIRMKFIMIIALIMYINPNGPFNYVCNSTNSDSTFT